MTNQIAEPSPFSLPPCLTELRRVHTLSDRPSLVRQQQQSVRHIADYTKLDPVRKISGLENNYASLVSPEGALHRQNLLGRLSEIGLKQNDVRLKSTIQVLNESYGGLTGTLSMEEFEDVMSTAPRLLHRALSGKMIIPDFKEFCDELLEIYEIVQENTEGNNAAYIPELAAVDPEHFALSVCTVDGQQWSYGDSDIPFCIESCMKPIAYLMACEELGIDVVHEHMGREPSGQDFNELILKSMSDHGRRIPHNPMINAGAIMSCALIRQNDTRANRFNAVIEMWKRLCGTSKIGFQNSVYLSERDTADRNFCLGYMMNEYDSFPPNTDLIKTLEFYLQCCSIEVNSQMTSVLAATLANGGTCPITDDRVFQSDMVRNCLSLLLSCGMYNYSGEWAFSVGLPAKSGVSGCVFLIVPNVLGMCIWSPRLDDNGNSVRGVDFAKRLVERFNFHNYDNLRGVVGSGPGKGGKRDPTMKVGASKQADLIALLFAASEGDLHEIKRLCAQGVDMFIEDYDARTALHLAASEGHFAIVKFISTKSDGSNYSSSTLSARDRWNNTPLDDAYAGAHVRVVHFLETVGALRAWGLHKGAPESEIEQRKSLEDPMIEKIQAQIACLSPIALKKSFVISGASERIIKAGTDTPPRIQPKITRRDSLPRISVEDMSVAVLSARSDSDGEKPDVVPVGV
eukprot:224534_1